ncbi:hypothetical protein CEE45_05775 [Candidatus Heimdallarchaeota archaeon B3_Heim]|nr:MAG: hypothetical protein CEE45_05775 [Candidatus Heimdallarchaeota archaeon B3_Heim]
MYRSTMYYFIADIVPVRNQFIRMADERYRIRRIVQTAPTISAGMAERGDYCQSIHTNLIWELFRSIDYESDLEPATHWLQTLLTIIIIIYDMDIPVDFFLIRKKKKTTICFEN